MNSVEQAQFDRALGKLTARQQDVLRNMLAGANDQDIAHALGISTSAVRKHVERICDFFTTELRDLVAKDLKRADLLRLVATYRPNLLKLPQLAMYSHQDFDQPKPNQAPRYLLEDEESSQPASNSEATLPGLAENGLSATAKELNRRGKEEYMKGNLELAQRYFQAAVALDPQRADVHFNLGSVYEKQMEKDLARQHYHCALNITGKAADAAANNLARLEILAGNPHAALGSLEPRVYQVTDRWITSTMYKNIGWAYLLLGDYGNADRALQQSVALCPDFPAAYCLLAQVCEAKGEQESALAFWKKCLECPVSKGVAWNWPEIELWQSLALQALNRR